MENKPQNFGKRLTFEERKQIEWYVKHGKSCSEIAILINRSKNVVITEVRRAGKKFYSAKEGQRIADVNMENKYRKLSERNKGNKITFKMKQRIENLEMQIEILHDMIRSLMNDQKNKKL
jgi:IS30 family transposase